MSARRIVGMLLACAVLAVAAAGLVSRRGASVAPASAQTSGAEGGSRDAGAVPMKAAYPVALPDSAGRGLVERWCLVCHSAMLLTQQAKDSTGWEKTLAQMEKWGVAVTPEERDTLRSYLIGRFGPRATPPR